MTNGDLIRKVFPALDDATIGHIATGSMACFLCPLSGDQKRCCDQEFCDAAIYKYMKEEANINA